MQETEFYLLLTTGPVMAVPDIWLSLIWSMSLDPTPADNIRSSKPDKEKSKSQQESHELFALFSSRYVHVTCFPFIIAVEYVISLLMPLRMQGEYRNSQIP